MPRPALIVGAGIAGLTSALALLQRGFQVTVLEQATELREVGAGLQISPNGTRVLLSLGLGPALQEVVCTAAAKEVRLGSTGQAWPLFDLGADALARFGAPYWLVHRGDLSQVLLRAVQTLAPNAVRLGARVVKHFEAEEHISLVTEDGQQHSAELALAADGVHSVLRHAVAGAAAQASQFTGLMAWRGVIPMARLPQALRANVGVNWLGAGGHVITYPLRRGALLNFVGIVERPDWTNESWAAKGTHEHCHRDLASWHADIHQLISAIDQPYQWALLGRAPLAHWATGRLCLLGDAAHPTLPFLAQGANMAIEDAALVARCLAEMADVPQALQRFEALRLPRTTKIVNASAANAARFHNPVLADPPAAAQYISHEWEPSKVRQRYDWLFEYDALTLPLN